MKYLIKKKLAFMSAVNYIKGFIRNVSGAMPLKLWGCVDTKSVIDYSITGDGVGDYDENTGKYKISVVGRGVNLFNPQELIKKFQNSETYLSGSYVCARISLKPKTWYYIKTFNPTIKTGGYFYLSKYSSPSSQIDGTIAIIDQTYQQYPRPYECAVQTDNTGCLYIGSYGIDDNDKYWYLNNNNIQIVEGRYTGLTVPDFEPYQEPSITNIYLDEPLADGQTINYKNDKLPFLSTVEGTTIFEATTQVQPENMEVIYYSTSKE